MMQSCSFSQVVALLNAPQTNLCCRHITEYGGVVLTQAEVQAFPPGQRPRWLKTLVGMRYHVDGNPSHPLVQGVENLAEKHCGASLINTAQSRGERDCKLDVVGYINPNLVWSNGHPFAQAHCVLARATRDIPPHKQILAFYANDPVHAGILLPF